MKSHTRRTTLVLHDNRINELKRLAASRNTSLSAVVDQLLAEGLHRSQSQSTTRKAPSLPVFDMGVPKANVADRTELYDVMESD